MESAISLVQGEAPPSPWNCSAGFHLCYIVSFFSPVFRSEMQRLVFFSHLPGCPLFLPSHQLHPTLRPSRPWSQTWCSHSNPGSHMPQQSFLCGPRSAKLTTGLVHFSTVAMTPLQKRRSVWYWPKTEPNKKRGRYFDHSWNVSKNKTDDGLICQRRCLHPVGGIKRAWGASEDGCRLDLCLSWILSLLKLHQRRDFRATSLPAKLIIFFPKWPLFFFFGSFSFLWHSVQVSVLTRLSVSSCSY